MKVRASRRARRLRGLVRTAGIVLLLGFWAAPGWLWRGEVHITGAADSAQEQRVRRLLPRPDVPLWALDAPGLAGRLANLPGIRRAFVHRLAWPARLEIRIEPRKPLGLLETPAGRMALDADGVIFPASSANRSLPRITGLHVGSRPEQHLAAAEWLALQGAGPGQLSRAGEDWRWSRGGQTVVIGRLDEISRKDRVARHVARLAGAKGEPVTWVDVSFPDAPAYRTSEPAEGGPGEKGVGAPRDVHHGDPRSPAVDSVPQPSRVRAPRPAEPPQRGPAADAQAGRIREGRAEPGSDATAGTSSQPGPDRRTTAATRDARP
ncbi:MAG: FtsQ-type POTRA domain-containing protein [Candidatus Sericytochromatia bacterium]|nr:FtsQ-type POTRA domain-containing protein [Candidatus Tanganyikabacteria bacterium]